MQATISSSFEQSARSWDAVVDTCEESFEPFTNQFAADALRLAAPTSGTRVLDVATGPGGLALAALRAGAEVTAIDSSRATIERLRERMSREERWRSITLVMDGQRFDLPDNLFHSAFSIFGLTFFEEPMRALREIHRTLRPGGRAVIAAWAPPSGNEAFRLIGEVAQRVWPEFRSPEHAPSWLRYRDTTTLCAAMTEAGFVDPEVHTVTRTWETPSPGWLVSRIGDISPGISSLLDAMPEDTAAAFSDELEESLTIRFGTGPVRLAIEAHLVAASKREN